MRNSVAVLFVLLAGCGTPDTDRVAREFKSEYPTYTVVSTVVGEGDSSNAYFHIKFKKPNDEKTYEEVWLYQELGWQNTSRIRENGRKERVLETK